MNKQEKEQSMVELYLRLQHLNELLKVFANINPEAFGNLYAMNSEFEEVVRDVLEKHNLLQTEVKH